MLKGKQHVQGNIGKPLNKGTTKSPTIESSAEAGADNPKIGPGKSAANGKGWGGLKI